MSRSIARCAVCHENLLHHQPDGTIEVIVGKVVRLIVDPTAHEGVNVILTCRCGAKREWVVRERNVRSFPATTRVPDSEELTA